MRQQVSKELDSGTTLNARVGTMRPSSGTSKKVKEAPKTEIELNAIDEEGLVCIRRLDKGIGQDPNQRAADEKFIKTHFGEISPMEMRSMFLSSKLHVLASLKRRREERTRVRGR